MPGRRGCPQENSSGVSAGDSLNLTSLQVQNDCFAFTAFAIFSREEQFGAVRTTDGVPGPRRFGSHRSSLGSPRARFSVDSENLRVLINQQWQKSDSEVELLPPFASLRSGYNNSVMFMKYMKPVQKRACA